MYESLHGGGKQQNHYSLTCKSFVVRYHDCCNVTKIGTNWKYCTGQMSQPATELVSFIDIWRLCFGLLR